MENVFTKLKGSTPLETVRNIISSRFFPFVLAAFEICFYYLGWDLVTFYMITAVVVAMLILLDDLTPLVAVFLLMDVMISYKNSPSTMAGNSDFFTRPAVIAQIAVLVFIVIASFLVRLFVVAKERTFKPSPVFYGLCFLAVSFILGGLGSANYMFMDFAYGLFMAFFFLGIFTLIAANTNFNEENFEKICYGFLALSALLVIELGIKYATNFSEILANGTINKGAITFGWGVWNTIGMLLSISIPPVFMLASKYKYGFGFIIYATVLMICAIFTGSRQGALGAAFAYVVSAVAVVIKSRSRLYNLITLGGILLVGIVVVAVKWEKMWNLFSRWFDNLWTSDGDFSGNGRTSLITIAMQYFVSNPFFGCGFFSDFSANDPDFTNLANLIPTFAHNTYAELLATCGIVGIIAYSVHRIQTFISFAEKPSFNKFYLGLSVGTMLLLSLLDNHIFYILPTMIYSSLLVFATAGEQAEGKCMLSAFAKRSIPNTAE